MNFGISFSVLERVHYFHAQNLSVKNREKIGVLAGVPFLSLSRAQIPPSPSLPTTQASFWKDLKLACLPASGGKFLNG